MDEFKDFIPDRDIVGISVVNLKYASKWDYWQARFFGVLFRWSEKHLDRLMEKTINLNFDSLKVHFEAKVDILDELSNRFGNEGK